jgi:dsDNA-binding SOS-regulon protein
MNKINIGAEIVDVVFKALGIPVSFSSKIKLIENVMSAGETNPKIQLRNNIADSIDKIVKESNISDDDAEAVKNNVKESLEKVTKQDYIDNISSPQSLINDIINNHTDFGGAAEECYQSIIKSVVNALCTNNNIAVFVNEGLMLAKILSQNNKIQSSITDFNDALNELIEYFREKFLLKSEIKIENTDNAFSYSNSKVGFYGRGAEVNKIDEFMNCDKPFTFWSITGYGGMGKSKLAYNIAKKYDKQNWTVIWYDSNNTDIDKIFGKDFVHNVLFIVDYAGSKIDAVRKIITKSIAKTKNQDENRIIHIRLLMVERDDYSKNGSMNYSAIETWYQKIFNCQDFDGKKNFEYKNEPNKSNKPLNLSAINDTEALYNIIDDFTVNVKGEKQKLNNSKKDEIIDFVRNKLCQTEKDSHFADRCIFILFTTDAVLSGKDIKNWDTAKLLENYLKRFERILPNANNMRNHKQLLAFATAVGGIDIDDCKNYVFAPYIEKLENDFSNDDDLCDAIRTLCEKECEKGVAYTLITPLQPDLVGEYNFIYEMQCIRSAKKKKELLKTFLSTDYIDYFCTFMERCYADWYNEEYLSTLTDMIINIIIEMDDDNIAFQYSDVLFTITYNIDDYTVNLSYVEKISRLLEEYKTNKKMAFVFAVSLCNVSGRTDNYDKSLEQADKINELLKEYKTPEIALKYTQALVNVSNNADNYDKSLEQANKINELQKYYKTPEIALVYAQALVNVSNKADNYDKSLEQADKINELLQEYKTPEIALEYAQALVNVSNKADNYDKSLKQANKINELLKYYKPPEIALEYAKALASTALNSDNCNTIISYKTAIYNLYQEYKTLGFAGCYAMILAILSFNLDTADEIRNICLAGINEIKADGFNSERIEEIEKIINDNLSKKLKDNL